MTINYELGRLKSADRIAFNCKQAAWAAYADAKQRTNDAYYVMDSAWQERCRAKEEMSHKAEAIQTSGERYAKAQEECCRIRARNEPRITKLRREAKTERQAMRNCFRQANKEYAQGNKGAASAYNVEGRDHKDRLNSLKADISALYRDIEVAQRSAEKQSPKATVAAYRAAKAAFHLAKSVHLSAEAKFKKLKAERDQLKADFKTAQAEYLRIHSALQRKLEKAKSANPPKKGRSYRLSSDTST